jgi:opacity protein-like surface antigen
MKKFLLLAGVACLFSANAEAGVQLNQYISGKVSYDWYRNKWKDADMDGIERERLNKERWGSHLAYGVQAGFVRGELELNNTMPLKYKVQDDGVEGKLKLYNYSVMGNAYFDFLNCTSWTPYIGAGLGTAWMKAKMFGYADGQKFKALDKSVYNLAWQVMAGVVYKINSNWSVDAGYRYADLGRVRYNYGEGVAKVTARDHEIMLGARYNF